MVVADRPSTVTPSAERLSPATPGELPDRLWRPLVVALLGLAALLFFLNLGGVPLFDGDEPRYAQACREMLQRGDLSTPYFNGNLRFQKPIFFYWVMLGSYALFGGGELAARLPAACAGLLLTGLVLLFARRRLGTAGSLFAGAALALCLQSTILGRAATPDMLLCLLITGALFAFYTAYTGPERSKRCYYLFWALTGLAGLTKGVIGFGFPILIAGLFTLTERRLPQLLREGRLPLGVLLMLLIGAPWYGLMVLRYGETFTGFFFGREHVGRFSNPMEGHRGPIFYYLLAFLPAMAPWSIWAPGGIWASLTRSVSPDWSRVGRFAAVWAAVVFGVFSLAGTKLPHYVYPAYPALALLAAIGWRAMVSGDLRQGPLGLTRAVGLFMGLVALVLIGAAAGLVPRVQPTGVPAPLAAGVAVAAGTALVSGVGAWILARAGRLASGVALTAGAAALVFTPVFAAPLIHERTSGEIVRMGRRLRKVEPNARIVVWGKDHSAVVYYSGRTGIIQKEEDGGRLLQLAEEGPLWILARERDVELLKPFADAVERDGRYVLLRGRAEAGR